MRASWLRAVKRASTRTLRTTTAQMRQQIVTRTLAKNGVTINVNVQLTIPETTDEKVFGAFFAAMRKHLIDDNVS